MVKYNKEQQKRLNMNTLTLVYALLGFVTLAVPLLIIFAIYDTRDELVTKVTKLAKSFKLNREQAEIYTIEEWPELSSYQRSKVLKSFKK